MSSLRRRDPRSTASVAAFCALLPGLPGGEGARLTLPQRVQFHSGREVAWYRHRGAVKVGVEPDLTSVHRESPLSHFGGSPDSKCSTDALCCGWDAKRSMGCLDVEPSVAIRLLLVDDDVGFRSSLRQLLEQRADAQGLGEAASGEEAIRLTGDLHPDVVLMDLVMPRMNGLEATRQLKTRWPDLAVVVLTVHDEDVYRRTAFAAGATAFLQKKMLGVDLWPTLVRILNRNG